MSELASHGAEQGSFLGLVHLCYDKVEEVDVNFIRKTLLDASANADGGEVVQSLLKVMYGNKEGLRNVL